MATPFPARSPAWANSPATTTPLSAANLTDMETRLSNFSRLNFVTVSGTHSALDGELSLCSSNNYTVTLPSPAANSTVAVWAGTSVTGALPITVTTPSGAILGVGQTSGASITLGAPGAYVGLYSDGTNYFILSGQLDTGWVAPTLATNWNNGGFITPGARLLGDRVYTKGTLSNNTGGTVTAATILTLPASFPTPAALIQIGSVAVSTVAGIVSVTTSKTISFSGAIPNGAAFYLDGLSFATV